MGTSCLYGCTRAVEGYRIIWIFFWNGSQSHLHAHMDYSSIMSFSDISAGHFFRWTDYFPLFSVYMKTMFYLDRNMNTMLFFYRARFQFHTQTLLFFCLVCMSYNGAAPYPPFDDLYFSFHTWWLVCLSSVLAFFLGSCTFTGANLLKQLYSYVCSCILHAMFNWTYHGMR